MSPSILALGNPVWAFLLMVLFQNYHVFNCRSEVRSAVLKDGTFQLVRSWERRGERVLVVRPTEGDALVAVVRGTAPSASLTCISRSRCLPVSAESAITASDRARLAAHHGDELRDRARFLPREVGELIVDAVAEVGLLERVEIGRRLARGEHVNVALDPERAFVFPPEAS